jgi:N-acetylglucosaminyldiphosphoundecaprenol N-acetyl-beta-D-mannosaminyltransferase
MIAPAPLKSVQSTRFGGVRVDALTFAELFDRIDLWLTDRRSRSHHVACLNAYCVSLAIHDRRLAGIYERADVAGADGMPFTKWIELFVRSQCDRLYGPDIILRLAERSRETGYTFYLYGGAPDMNVGMKTFLECHFPHIRVVGAYSPPFRPLTEEEDRVVCSEINGLRPDIVCVGLGTPKQDFWIDDHLEKIRGSVLIACGAAFDFFGGRVRMAPRFVQRSGFEWLYRLLGPDIGRLWRRYTIDHARFLWHFVLGLLSGRDGRRCR